MPRSQPDSGGADPSLGVSPGRPSGLSLCRRVGSPTQARVSPGVGPLQEPADGPRHLDQVNHLRGKYRKHNKTVIRSSETIYPLTSISPCYKRPTWIKLIMIVWRWSSREDMTVLLQTGVESLSLPRDEAVNLLGVKVLPDITYLAPDCLHPSQKLHALGNTNE